jgi:phospholipid transport system substrate-binding protein
MRRVKTLIAALIITGFGLMAAPVQAQSDAAEDATASPEAVVDRVVAQALMRIAESQETLKTDETTASKIFDEVVRPYIDAYIMARFVMGPAAQRADQAEIRRLSNALIGRVANLYTSSLQSYVDDIVDFAGEGEVFVRTVTQDGQRAIVSARVRGPGVDDRTLRLQLYQRDEQWRVFDIESSGVSILLVFRDALQDTAGRNADIDAMIAALEEGMVDVDEALEEAEDQTAQ